MEIRHFRKALNRTDAVGVNREHSRPGCSSARPRAEHERTTPHRMVERGLRSVRAARARPAAPEAGALPVSTASFHPSNHRLTGCERRISLCTLLNMKIAALSKFLLIGELFFLCANGGFAASTPPVEIPKANTNEMSIADVQLTYLRLQEEIQATQLAIERGQQDAQTAIRRTLDDMTGRFEQLEQSLNTQRAYEFSAMQRINHLVLVVAGSFVAVVFISLLFISYFQWRVASRLAELSSVRPTLLTLAGSRALPNGGPAGPDQAVEQANARLFGVVEQLQLRIFELEKVAHLPMKEEVETAEAMAGKT